MDTRDTGRVTSRFRLAEHTHRELRGGCRWVFTSPGSVVIQSVPRWTVAVGNPARVIRQLSDGKRQAPRPSPGDE